MRKIAGAVLLAFAVACASSAPSEGEPEVKVRTVKVPESRSPNANVFSSVLEIEIKNPRQEALLVERIQLSSVSIGTYSIQPVDERPQKSIPAGATEIFKVWAQIVAQETASEGRDPIFVRGIVEFRAGSGAFRKTFTQQVKPSTM